MRKTRTIKAPALPASLMKELAALVRSSAKSHVAIPKGYRPSVDNTRVPHPTLPQKGPLTKAQQWRSLLWMIDTAQAHGDEALRGLTIALARMIQAEAFAVLFLDARPHRSPDGSQDDLLWDKNLPITQNGRSLASLLVNRRKREYFELCASAVIANFWEPWRLVRAFQNLGPTCAWGAWCQSLNHHAVVWHPWPLIWIDNGNHSTTAAILKGGGKIQCEASFDAEPLLRVVTTNGRHWFGENGRKLSPVYSLPMAGILEIGRRLIQSKERPRSRKPP